MRSIPTTTQTQRELRNGVIVHHLVEITAKNRSTGANETLRMWTGDTDRAFTIDGVSQSFVAAGSVLDIAPIRFSANLEVIYHEITVSPFTDVVQAALREYEPRLAPVAVYQANYDPENMQLTNDPFQVIDGTINEMSETLPAPGGEASLTLAIASSMRRFTVSPALFKSNEAMKKRNPNDMFRKYVDVQGAIKVAWGEKLGRANDGDGSSNG